MICQPYDFFYENRDFSIVFTTSSYTSANIATSIEVNEEFYFVITIDSTEADSNSRSAVEINVNGEVSYHEWNFVSTGATQ